MPVKTMLLIFNPTAGQGVFPQHLFEVIDRFTRHEYLVTAYPTQGRRDAFQMAMEQGHHYDCLVCSGGDGTLNELVDALMQMEKRPLFGYIPAGTTNDFAYSIGLPGDVLLAANTICDGAPLALDIGKFQEEYFSYVAAFGLFTDVSYGTSQSLKNMLGHAAYVLQGMLRLTHIKSWPCAIRCDGEEITGNFIFGMVTNSSSIGGFRLPASVRTDPGDGLFTMILLREIPGITELHHVVATLLGAESWKQSDLFVLRRARKIRVCCDTPLDWTLDGEFGGSHTCVDIQVQPGAIEILAPTKALPEDAPVEP